MTDIHSNDTLCTRCAPATLATAKHGGCVQLPTSERARFEACAHAQSYRGGNILTDRDADHPDVYADPLAQLAWKIWQAALAAQPSPGSQGDAPSIDYEDLLDQAKDLIHCGCSVNGAFEWLLEQLTGGEALAARQPVGERPMEIRICELRHVSLKPNRRYVFTVDPNCAKCRADAAYALGHTDSKPAQAVDLEELRRAVCVVGVVGQIDGHDVVRRNSVLDVIDSKAVGNG